MDKRSETVQFHLQHLLNWVEKTYIHEDDKPLVSNLMTYTRGFWKGLFTCYDHPHVPRTNNDHERFFRQTKTRHRRFPVACTCLRSRSFRLPIPLRPVKPVRIAGQLAHLVRRRASSEAFEGGHFPNFCTVSGHCLEGMTVVPVVCNVFATCLQIVRRAYMPGAISGCKGRIRHTAAGHTLSLSAAGSACALGARYVQAAVPARTGSR